MFLSFRQSTNAMQNESLPLELSACENQSSHFFSVSFFKSVSLGGFNECFNVSMFYYPYLLSS